MKIKIHNSLRRVLPNGVFLLHGGRRTVILSDLKYGKIDIWDGKFLNPFICLRDESLSLIREQDHDREVALNVVSLARRSMEVIE